MPLVLYRAWYMEVSQKYILPRLQIHTPTLWYYLAWKAHRRQSSLTPAKPIPLLLGHALASKLRKKDGSQGLHRKKEDTIQNYFRVTLSTAKLRAQSSSCTVKTEIMFTVSRKILWISTRWDKGI